MIKNFINIFNSTLESINSNNIDNINPNLIRYFKIEYGKDWKDALNRHLENIDNKNDKSAA